MKIQTKLISFKVSSDCKLSINGNKLIIYKDKVQVFYSDNLTKYIGLYNNKIFYKNNEDIIYVCLDNFNSSKLSLNINIMEVYLYDKYLFISEFKNNTYSIYRNNINNSVCDVIFSKHRIHSFTIQNDYIIIKSPYFINKYIILDFQGYIKKDIYDLEYTNIPVLENKLFYKIVVDAYNSFISIISIDKQEIKIKGRIIKYIIRSNILYVLAVDSNNSNLYSINISNLRVNKLLSSYLYINNIFIIHNTLFYDISDFKYQLVIKNNKIEDTLPVLQSEFKIKNCTSSNQKCFYTIFQKKNSKKIKGIFFFLHGGPHTYVDRDYDELKSLLSNNGEYIIIIINYHGSTTYGYKYEHVIHGRWGEYELKDIEEVYYEVLNKFPNLSHNIRVMGISYGGILAQLLILKKQLPFKKVISISCPYDIQAFYENLTIFNKNIFKKRALYNKITNYNIREFNPVNYLRSKEIKTNNIYIYGTKDTKIAMNQEIKKSIIKNVDVFIPVLSAGHSLQEIFFNIEDKKKLLKLILD